MRKYKKSTPRSSCYTRDKLLEAVEEVKSGRMSGYQAAKSFSIPRMTIMCRVSGRRGNKSATMGRSTVLSADIEKTLAENLHTMEKYGFGISKKEVIELVAKYITDNDLKKPL